VDTRTSRLEREIQILPQRASTQTFSQQLKLAARRRRNLPKYPTFLSCFFCLFSFSNCLFFTRERSVEVGIEDERKDDGRMKGG